MPDPERLISVIAQLQNEYMQICGVHAKQNQFFDEIGEFAHKLSALGSECKIMSSENTYGVELGAHVDSFDVEKHECGAEFISRNGYGNSGAGRSTCKG